LISLFGCSVTSLGFAAIFWQSHAELQIFHQSLAGFYFFSSSIKKLFQDGTLELILSSKVFLLSCIIIYYFSFNIGIGPVKHILLGEMFLPEEQKTVAGLCHTWYWISSFATGKVFLYLVAIFGLTNIFISISVILILNMVFTFFVVPETRKKKEDLV